MTTAKSLPLHILTPVNPVRHASRSTYLYRTRREHLDRTDALTTARNAAPNIPAHMVTVDSVEYVGMWAILTITFDLDAPRPTE